MKEVTVAYVPKAEVDYNRIWGEVRHVLAIITKVTMVLCLVTSTYKSIKQYNQSLFVPIRLELNETESIKTKKALATLNCPKEKIEVTAKAIVVTSKILPKIYLNGVEVDNNILIATLMETESEFSVNARSRMGYKSLMQTPTATKRPITDTAHGADLLQEKLQIAKGDLEKALTFYKGSPTMVNAKGKSTDGHKQALEVIAKYKKVVDKVKMV